MIQNATFDNATIAQNTANHIWGDPTAITIKIKQTEYSVSNNSDMTEISLLLLKLLIPQSIKITPVIRHKLVVMNLISNQTIPCADHHKHKNSRFASLIACLLSAKDK